MTAFEIHLITLCALALAITQAGPPIHRAVKNWHDRRMIHKRHLDSL